ncbi:ferredoxin [Clostridium acetobutylicum]|nr:ferredoxin [Clostridium acetobutylicum]
MNLITVNHDKCVKCGICVNECPEQIIKMKENCPEDICPQKCIACGHCVAVCPKEAIDNVKTPLINQKSSKKFSKLTPAEAENFLRSRRSIRSYKKTSVPREKLMELVNIAHFAPTGGNLQSVSYIIIDDRNILNMAIELTAKELERDELLSKRYATYIRSYLSEGIDSILRGAPCLVLATADVDFPRGRENSIFSLAYMELYAPTVGLGSCWAGVFEKIALRDNSPMLKLFNVPKGKKITGAVMVGYPKYNYPRLVDRNPLEVNFYQSK